MRVNDNLDHSGSLLIIFELDKIFKKNNSLPLKMLIAKLPKLKHNASIRWHNRRALSTGRPHYPVTIQQDYMKSLITGFEHPVITSTICH